MRTIRSWSSASALAATAIISATLLRPIAAGAQWSTTGTGTAGAAATTMPNGATPTATARSNSVSLTWPAATFANGNPVAGYVIHRYNAVNGSQATVGAACAGVVTAVNCIEQSVPSGTWIYTDIPVQTNWTGVESQASSQVSIP